MPTIDKNSRATSCAKAANSAVSANNAKAPANLADLDAQAREKIINEVNKNFFVEAGAGSGKTTSLVGRMVSMVKSGFDVSKICAITFTKAAANEFYYRFQTELSKSEDPLCVAALENIDLCFMGTIDSFCDMVLHEHPAAAGISSDAAIVQDEDALKFYKYIYIEILQGAYGQALQDVANVFKSIHGANHADVFCTSMFYLMEHRNANFVLPHGCKYISAQDIDSATKHLRAYLIDVCEILLQHPELAPAKPTKLSTAAWNVLPTTYATIKKKWSDNFSSVTYAIGALNGLRFSEDITAFGLTDTSLIDEKKFEFGKELKQEFANIKNTITYNASMPFLLDALRLIEEKWDASSNLSFFDNLYYLRETLRRDAAAGGALAKHIYARHSYFLIDEFQDTNPMQAEIFFYLAATCAQTDWKVCVPRPGSLFIVGDPKQSIYRFRNADVGQFNRVKALFSDARVGEVIKLTKNFRSTKSMCDYFNKEFLRLMPEQSENMSAFDPIDTSCASNDAQEFTGQFYYKVQSKDGYTNVAYQNDPDSVSEIICALTHNEKFKVYKKTPDGARVLSTLTYSDFMVITPDKKNMDSYINALKVRNIPYYVEGRVLFHQCPSLILATSIYAALTDLSDEMSLYAVLRSPIFACTDADIYDYVHRVGESSGTQRKQYNRKLTIAAVISAEDVCSLGSSGAQKVAQSLGTLRGFAQSNTNLTPAALFEKIIDTFELLKYVTSENLEVLYYTLELLRGAQGSGAANSHAKARAFLREKLSGAAAEERTLSLSENTNAVHLANLHKVKGLQAPVVILTYAPDHTLKKKKADNRIDYSANHPTGYIFRQSVKAASGRYSVPFEAPGLDDSCYEGAPAASEFVTFDEIFKAAHDAECEALIAEELRKVYVAVTRAENALIVCSPYKVSAKGALSEEKSMWGCVAENLLDFSNFFCAEDADNSVCATSWGLRGAVPSDHSTPIEADTDGIISSNQPCNKKKNLGHHEQVFAGGGRSEGLRHTRHSEEFCEKRAKSEESHTSASGLYEKAKVNCVFNNSAPLAATYSILNPSRIDDETYSESGEDDARSNKRVPFAAHRAYLGTITHRLLEIMVCNINNLEQIDVSALVDVVLRECADENHACIENDARKMLENVANIMMSGGFAQDNGTEQDIFSALKRADVVQCEVPFKWVRVVADCENEKENENENENAETFANDASPTQEIVSGIIDLVYKLDGTWHIIDWKTNHDGSHLDEHYATQLDLYTRALRQMANVSATARTYHIKLT